jgi:hypothetical protein
MISAIDVVPQTLRGVKVTLRRLKASGRFPREAAETLHFNIGRIGAKQSRHRVAESGTAILAAGQKRRGREPTRVIPPAI